MRVYIRLIYGWNEEENCYAPFDPTNPAIVEAEDSFNYVGEPPIVGDSIPYKANPECPLAPDGTYIVRFRKLETYTSKFGNIYSDWIVEARKQYCTEEVESLIKELTSREANSPSDYTEEEIMKVAIHLYELHANGHGQEVFTIWAQMQKQYLLLIAVHPFVEDLIVSIVKREELSFDYSREALLVRQTAFQERSACAIRKKDERS